MRKRDLEIKQIDDAMILARMERMQLSSKNVVDLTQGHSETKGGASTSTKTNPNALAGQS